MSALEIQQKLRQRIRAAEPTLGVFVKTPAPQLIEALGGCGLDFVALDAEHGPFGAAELDHCILAGRSVDLPVLVRIRTPSPGSILEVLDMGAAGIIAPHVCTAEAANALAAACRYSGGRGFTGSSRAAEYGRIDGAIFRKASDQAVIFVAQIEDSEGVDNVAAIAAVDAVDALLIGRADLAVSLDVSGPDDAAVGRAVAEVLEVAKQHKKTTALFVNDETEVADFQQQGASFFIASTDQQLLRSAVTELATAFRSQ